MENCIGHFNLIIEWLKAHWEWLFFFSIAMFIVSIFGLRYFIIRIPPDYFFLSRKETWTIKKHPLLAFIVLFIKNVIGLFFVVVGLIMSIPGVAGQGVLTILIGLMLMNFPGKRKLELKIIKQPLILNTLNNIRMKAGKDPLRFDQEMKGKGD